MLAPGREGRAAVLDGEIVVYNPAGQIDFGAGLSVRTTNETQADELGLVRNRGVVLVERVTTSTFTPPVSIGDNIGPRWAQVRWSKSASMSQASAEERAGCTWGRVPLRVRRVVFDAVVDRL